MSRLLNYIGSRRFAIYLLVITTLIILLSNLLPTLSVMDASEVEMLKKERPLVYALSASVGVERLARSPYFQVIPVFIFLSIAVCTLRRLRGELEKRERETVAPRDLPVRHSVSLKAPRLEREEISSILIKKRWRVLTSEGAIIYAGKGVNGLWGSIGFHLGMEVVLVGVLISVAAGIDGKVMFTEGFPVITPKDIRWSFEKKLLEFPFSEMVLESFVPVFKKGFPVEYNSKVAAVGLDGRLWKYEIGVNRLLKVNDYKFIFSKAGYAPRFVLKKGDASTEAVVNLKISMPGDIDSFAIPEEGLSFKVEIFPDYYQENGVHKTRGKFSFNPVLFVEIEKDGKVIGRGFIPKGKKVNFNSYSLEFSELKHWMELMVSKDEGVPVIAAGFFMIALGLCVRFILNEKKLWIIMNETGVEPRIELGGRARFFPAMFEEELKMLTEEIGSMSGRNV